MPLPDPPQTVRGLVPGLVRRWLGPGSGSGVLVASLLCAFPSDAWSHRLIPWDQPETVDLAGSSDPEPEGARDYADAFQRLRDAGLPSIKGWQFGICHHLDPTPSLGSGQWSGTPTWKEPAPANESRFLYGGFLPITILDLDGSGADSDPREGIRFGSWMEGSIENHAREVWSELKNLDADSEWEIERHVQPRQLLFAAQVHEAGLEDLGNRITDLLLKRAPNPESLVLGAIGLLAQAEYQARLEEFYRNGDSKAFARNIQSVLQRFPEGWPHAAGARQLLVFLDEHESRKDAVLSGFKEAERATVALLLATPFPPDLSERVDSGDGFWTFSPSFRSDSGETPSDPWTSLLSQGPASLALLLRLIEAPVLTATPVERLPSWQNTSEYSGYDDTGLPNPFFSMERPATLSEVALALLEPLAPIDAKSENNLEEYRNEGGELRETLILALKPGLQSMERAYREDGIDGLSRFYLQHFEGNPNRYLSAIEHLLTNGTETEIRAVVTAAAAHLRNPDNYGGDRLPFWLVQQLNAKGHQDMVPEAASQLIAALRELIDNPDNHRAGERYQPTIRFLENAAEPEDLDTVVNQIAGSGGRPSLHLEVLRLQATVHSRDTVVSKLLAKAVTVDDSAIASTLVALAASLAYESESPNEPYQPAADRETWEVLIARETDPASGQAPVENQAAYAILVLSLDQESVEQAMEPLEFMGSAAWPYIREQAAKVLAGEKWTPPPRPEDAVSVEQLDSLIETFNKLDPTNIPAFLAGLSPPEQLRLAQTAETDPRLAVSARRAVLLVKEVVEVPGSAAHKLPGLDQLTGRVLSVEWIKDAVSVLRSRPPGEETVVLRLDRDGTLSGHRLLVSGTTTEGDAPNRIGLYFATRDGDRTLFLDFATGEPLSTEDAQQWNAALSAFFESEGPPELFALNLFTTYQQEEEPR